MPPPPREDERSWDTWRDKTEQSEERYREQLKRSGEGSSPSTRPAGLPRRPASPVQNARRSSKGSEEYGSRPRSPPNSLSDIYHRLEISRRREDSAEPGQIVSSSRSRSPDLPSPRRDSNPIPRVPSPSFRLRPMRSRSPSWREQDGLSSRGHPRDGMRKRLRSRSRSPGGDGGGRRRIRSRSRSPPGGGRRRLRSPRSRSPPGDGGMLKGEPGSVLLGLEGFTKTMHAALVSTSSLALAAQHLSRLRTFANPYTSSSSMLILSEAQRRVNAAEHELHGRMMDLQSAFTVLMKRTVAVPGLAQGDTSGLELDGIKERLVRLEEKPAQAVMALPASSTTDQAVAALPEPPSAPKPTNTTQDVEMEAAAPPHAQPPTSTVDPPTIAEKRSRAKELLNDLVRRVESVESLKSYLEDRCNDMENDIWIALGDDADRQEMTWRALERKRFKGMRAYQERIAAQEQKHNGEEGSGSKSQGNKEEEEWATLESKQNAVVAVAVDNKEIEQAFQQLQELKKEVDALRVTKANGTTESEEYKPDIQALATEVQNLKKELDAERAAKTQREQDVAKQMLLSIKGELASIIRKEIARSASTPNNPQKAASPVAPVHGSVPNKQQMVVSPVLPNNQQIVASPVLPNNQQIVVPSPVLPNNQQMAALPGLPVYGLEHGHIPRPVSQPQPSPPNMLSQQHLAQPPTQQNPNPNPNPTNGHIRDLPPHMQPNEPVEHFRNIAAEYRLQQLREHHNAAVQRAWFGYPQNQQPQ